ncbi:hypothetical protein KO516_23085 [Citreicella sp. C3M06]|uniref:hypothetical protein n=1 Tax=Citreicella sp. C3M06 TaxID=2841564 RepID=UPI001C09A74E|nr:hypothetical protein [Citreicella sp. C3M06]MBU2963659.1 hypothetical protein [Citreicella sp. C3M06]
MRYDQVLRQPGYHSAFFTTYSFDPDLFDDAVLVGLHHAGCKNVVVIADTAMVNRSFVEIGQSRRAGRDYHLAKRSVPGAFHPKITLQLGHDRGRLMLGSANLTGPGLAGNLEVVSVLEVDEDRNWAAPLIVAAIDYLSHHASDEDEAFARAMLRARQRSPWLAEVERADIVKDPDGRRHALITEQSANGVVASFEAFVGADQVSQLVVVSPFWDANLSSARGLAERLGAEHLSLVVDPKEQDFGDAALAAVENASLHSGADIRDAGERRLHAKMIIAHGTNKDYVLSGSANATRAGLHGGNAEAGLLQEEDPRSALDRLGLSSCLLHEMPVSALRLRSRSEMDIEVSDPVRDGGTFTFESGRVAWIPPEGSDAFECLVSLESSSRQELAQFTPEDGSPPFHFPVGNLDSQPRQARVLFPDGVVSAPAPISFLRQLARNAEPSMPRAQRQLLEAIESYGQIHIDAYDLVAQLEAMVDQGARRKGGSRKTKASDQDDAEEKHRDMTEEEFLALDDAKGQGEMEDADRFSAYGELRRQMNRILSISTSTVEEFADLEDEANDLALSENVTSPDPDQDDQKAKSASDEIVATDAPPRRARRSGEIEADMEGHIRSYSERIVGEDPLSIRNAAILRLLVMTLLADAAPAGEAASPERPVAAAHERGGWVRMLGRLLVAHHSEWPSSSVLSGQLDAERIEALGLTLFTSILASEAAQIEKMAPSVQKPLAQVSASIARDCQVATEGNGDARGHLEHSVARHAAYYAVLVAGLRQAA